MSNTWEIWIASSCRNVGGPGGWGVILFSPNGETHSLGGSQEDSSALTLQLAGAIAGLNAVGDLAGDVKVFTDNELLIRYGTGDKQDKTSPELVTLLNHELKFHAVQWYKASAHAAGTPFLESAQDLADEYAAAAGETELEPKPEKAKGHDPFADDLAVVHANIAAWIAPQNLTGGWSFNLVKPDAESLMYGAGSVVIRPNDTWDVFSLLCVAVRKLAESVQQPSVMNVTVTDREFYGVFSRAMQPEQHRLAIANYAGAAMGLHSWHWHLTGSGVPDGTWLAHAEDTAREAAHLCGKQYGEQAYA